MKIMYRVKGKDPLNGVWNQVDGNMILYACSDGGSIVFRDAIFPIQKGALCFVAGGKSHYTVPDDPGNYERSKIYLTEEETDTLLRMIPETDAFRQLFRDHAVVYAQIPPARQKETEKLFLRAKEGLDRKPPDRATFLCCFLELMLCLRDTAAAYAAPPSDPLTDVIAFIHAHYAQPLTLDGICQTAHMSKYHFCRRFKEAMGVTVMEYVADTRITAAKELLRQDHMTVSAIARQCGFSGDSYFSQAFRRQTGMSPAAYRKQWRKTTDRSVGHPSVLP